MRAMTWVALAGALGGGLLSVPFFVSAGSERAARLIRPALRDEATDRMAPPPPRDDFERAMREAQRWHIEAWRLVNDERYGLEAWDSSAADRLDHAAWRGQLLAIDSGGCLCRARASARRAAALAHTPEEKYRAALLRAVLACEAGDRRAEAQQVRVLTRLSLHQWITQLWVRHVASHRSGDLSPQWG